MNNKQYSNIEMVLTGTTFNFEKSEGEFQISLNTIDKISIGKIQEKSFTVYVSSQLSFEPVKNTYVKVEYEAQIGTTEKESIDEIVKSIKDGQVAFGAVFAKASLLISQITNDSAFGPIITVPMYNPQVVQIDIKN